MLVHEHSMYTALILSLFFMEIDKNGKKRGNKG